MKRFFVIFAALMLLFGGVACSQDTQDDAADTAGDVADEAEDQAKNAADEAEDVGSDVADRASGEEVDIDDNTYEPDELKVKRGEEVTWTNQDDVEHTVTADNDSFESENLGEGDEFDHRFLEEGEYKYHCEVHGADVMSGTITVSG